MTEPKQTCGHPGQHVRDGGLCCATDGKVMGRERACPVCGTDVLYRRWYLGRDGYWCPCCYD